MTEKVASAVGSILGAISTDVWSYYNGRGGHREVLFDTLVANVSALLHLHVHVFFPKVRWHSHQSLPFSSFQSSHSLAFDISVSDNIPSLLAAALMLWSSSIHPTKLEFSLLTYIMTSRTSRNVFLGIDHFPPLPLRVRVHCFIRSTMADHSFALIS